MAHHGVHFNTNTGGDTIPTSIEGIISALARRGCTDLTSSIDLSTCSDQPYAGGGFCEVYRGTLYGGTSIAIKSLKVYGSQLERDSEGQRVLKRAAKELYHWSKLNHPNVLPLMGLAVFKGFISMISEWMENGDLPSYLKLKPNADRTKLCMGVCAGLCYIHEKGMVHGDLKGANIMISPNGAAMIADFGNTRLKDLTLTFGNTTSRGLSVRWAAPELLLEDDVPQVSMEADVYAYGMTVLEALSGKVPYDGLSERRVLALVFSNKVPTRPDIGISDDIWELLISCWAQAPSERPKITSIGDRLEALFLPRELPESLEDIVATLAIRGCLDLTSGINWATCSHSRLAGGGFGDIYLGALHSGTRIAIKSLGDDDHFLGGYNTQRALKRAAKKLYYWSKLKHPNILPLMGLAVFKGSLSMVSGWMDNGNLITYLRLNPDADRIRLCMGICSGLCYIHANRMVYGDMRGTNIMISPSGTALISGFGDARWQTRDPTLELISIDSYGVSLRWAAPELILDEGGDGPRLSMEADVYAYGMTVLETLTGNVPYEGYHDSRVLAIVALAKRVPPRPEMISDGLWELLNSCWAWVPSERPKITTVRDRLDALFPSYSE